MGCEGNKRWELTQDTSSPCVSVDEPPRSLHNQTLIQKTEVAGGVRKNKPPINKPRFLQRPLFSICLTKGSKVFGVPLEELELAPKSSLSPLWKLRLPWSLIGVLLELLQPLTCISWHKPFTFTVSRANVRKSCFVILPLM